MWGAELVYWELRELLLPFLYPLIFWRHNHHIQIRCGQMVGWAWGIIWSFLSLCPKAIFYFLKSSVSSAYLTLPWEREKVVFFFLSWVAIGWHRNIWFFLFLSKHLKRAFQTPSQMYLRRWNGLKSSCASRLTRSASWENLWKMERNESLKLF